MAAFKGVNLSSIQKVLPAEPWDVVVIQQVSSLSWRPESYEPWGDKLIARIRALAPLKDIVGRFINTGKMPDDVRSADTIHLSQAGQYLQANVWVAKLFGSDLKKSEMKKDIAGKYDNALLRACALDAVRVVK